MIKVGCLLSIIFCDRLRFGVCNFKNLKFFKVFFGELVDGFLNLLNHLLSFGEFFIFHHLLFKNPHIEVICCFLPIKTLKLLLNLLNFGQPFFDLLNRLIKYLINIFSFILYGPQTIILDFWCPHCFEQVCDPLYVCKTFLIRTPLILFLFELSQGLLSHKVNLEIFVQVS